MKKYLTIACVFLAAIVIGCKEDKVIPIKGDIVGFVKLFDEKGVELDDKSSVTVWLDENRSAATNDVGRFEFKDIKPGTFKLVFEKEGYSVFTRYNFIFAGGAVPAVISEVQLIALPDIEVTDYSVRDDIGALVVKGTMTEADSYYFIYYFGNDDKVSNENYRSMAGYTYCCGLQTSFEQYVTDPDMPGPVYMAVYACSRGNDGGKFNYYDYERELTINSAVTKLFGPVKIR